MNKYQQRVKSNIDNKRYFLSNFMFPDYSINSLPSDYSMNFFLEDEEIYKFLENCYHQIQNQKQFINNQNNLDILKLPNFDLNNQKSFIKDQISERMIKFYVNSKFYYKNEILNIINNLILELENLINLI